MDVKKPAPLYIKSQNRRSENDVANQYKKQLAQTSTSSENEKPMKTRFQFDEERRRLADEFRASQNNKKNLAKIAQIPQAPVLGRNQETVWNQPVSNNFKEEISDAPFEDDLMPVMSDNSENYPKFKASEPSPKSTITKNKEQEGFPNFMVAVDQQIVFQCVDENTLKEYIEQLLLENENISTDDIVVMKRLKLSTGIILE